MKGLGAQLDSAMEKNAKPAPDSLYGILSVGLIILLLFIGSLAALPLPDASKITFIPVDTVRNDELITKSGQGLLEKLLADSKDKPPFSLQFDNILYSLLGNYYFTPSIYQIRFCRCTSSIANSSSTR